VLLDIALAGAAGRMYNGNHRFIVEQLV